MKHRSLGIFIILAATLAAIPQASQELSALRNAVGQRARVELWNAFLALQSGAKGAPQIAPQAAPATAEVAGCETGGEKGNGATSKTAPRRDDDRREAKPQPRRADEAETAMIIVDPSDGPQMAGVALDAKTMSEAVRRALRHVPADKAHGGAELAMLVPPGEDIEIGVDGFDRAAPSQFARDKKGTWLRRDEIARLEEHGFAETAHDRELARRGQRDAERAREAMRRRTQNGAQTKGVGVEVKTAEQFFKLFKVKANEKIGPAAPVALPVAFGGRTGGPVYVPAPPAATE